LVPIHPKSQSSPSFYTQFLFVILSFILPEIPLEPGMQQSLPCHLATVVETECRGAVPVSWQSREIEMVLANGTLEIRSGQ
jgi:hypothetical protein